MMLFFALLIGGFLVLREDSLAPVSQSTSSRTVVPRLRLRSLCSSVISVALWFPFVWLRPRRAVSPRTPRDVSRRPESLGAAR